jgi:hypothetical protein
MTVRLIAVAAVLVSAYVHLYEWLNGGVSGYRHVHVIGPLFIVNVVAGVVIAALLLFWHHWLPPFLAAGFGASTLGGFAISVQWGLFGDHEKWQGPYIWTAAISEAVAIVAGLYLLSLELRSQRTSEPVHAA